MLTATTCCVFSELNKGASLTHSGLSPQKEQPEDGQHHSDETLP
ncbi:hypothetical protein CfE428DRAFT_6523 [Chthoniobacter flavus Ellin428]|uniref:Uncharacterized protein n=1 Tax=Chthoniobacter flavus Ellin428 TaxID=497964 RepID=B4DC82_9BACT|nr:hypothetical protein CfE428DRAFT_6523 [Chthoniobacter flavus Ellin428]